MMSEGNVKNRTIKVDALARVEGEGALYVKVSGGVVKDVRLDIYEPPRFFEAFLRGRSHKEPPDITARICGICPVAYQISSCNAIEDACGVKVDGQLRRLRRLLYCGEWIQSHALHVYMLHAPDFFGYQDALQLAKDHPEIVKRGLELKKTGNELMEVVGGRAVHPINVRVGGFYRVPTESQLSGLRDRLARALEASLETVRWVAGFDFPDFTQDYEFVALRHPEEYAIEDGILVSDRGLSIEAAEFESHVEEEHVAHSNALHARIKERGAYFVGPQARYSLNFDQLSPLAQQSARDAGLGSSCRNPFMSIVVRSVELVYACEEALRIIDAYEPPEQPFVKVEPQAGTGFGWSEAPRGMLYHRYTLDAEGTILDANIIPPTSQNQKSVESDLRAFVAKNVDLPAAELQWQCEQAIRNYDPCISCATHFLDLHIERD